MCVCVCEGERRKDLGYRAYRRHRRPSGSRSKKDKEYLSLRICLEERNISLFDRFAFSLSCLPTRASRIN